MSVRTLVFSALGREMAVFELDDATGTLAPIQAFDCPAIIQYGWPNRARTRLYVASSDAGPMARIKVERHFLQAFEIGPAGTLTPLAPPVPLRNRPLHLSLDREERHLLVAYNNPPDVTVHRLAETGAIAEELAQPPIDFGPTVHQVRVTPRGTVAIVPACAHDEAGRLAGSVGLYAYADGRLAPLTRIEHDPARAAPWQGVRNGAQGFAPRHVDFHPSRPWLYLCTETQNEIRLHDCGDEVALAPRFIRSTLEGARRGRSTQMAGAIQVHPNGRFVYVSNRAWQREAFADAQVFVDGVNDIAVFAIDQESGEPTLIQHAETLGFCPRSFGIDAAGRWLVAGNQEPGFVRAGETVAGVAPSLAVFRIGADGRLARICNHDLADRGDVCFWVGVETIAR